MFIDSYRNCHWSAKGDVVKQFTCSWVTKWQKRGIPLSTTLPLFAWLSSFNAANEVENDKSKAVSAPFSADQCQLQKRSICLFIWSMNLNLIWVLNICWWFMSLACQSTLLLNLLCNSSRKRPRGKGLRQSPLRLSSLLLTVPLWKDYSCFCLLGPV